MPVILLFAFSSGYNAPGIPRDEGMVLVYPELADWLVLNRAWDDRPGQNRSRENGPDKPLRVVKDDFTIVGEYGIFELFRRKAKVDAVQ